MAQLRLCLCLYAPGACLALKILEYWQIIFDGAGGIFENVAAKTIGIEGDATVETGAVVTGINFPICGPFAA